jgi:hypothetical protein
MVVQAYNPCYVEVELGGSQSVASLGKNKLKVKRAGGMAQVVEYLWGPEFNPQHRQKKKNKHTNTHPLEN